MITDCPSCSRKLRVPDELLGKQVKCPTCGHTFQASAVDSSQASAELPPVHPHLELDAHPGSADATQEFPQPPVVVGERLPEKEEATQLVACPNCDKLIEHGAPRCPFCGAVPGDEEEDEEYYADDRPWEERGLGGRLDAEPHRGVLIMVLGIMSLVFFCGGPLGMIVGICAWVMGQKDMRKMRENLMDPEGMPLTQAGWICGIIGTILSTLCGLGLLAYFGLIFTVFSAARNAPPPKFQSAPVQIKPPPQLKQRRPALPK
ncbi:MAG TPA: zinc-ribbon domain-containing protein [Gemmataceae bacterium]|jgi:predicted Zn finger-like uncharacterized protein|nr:zinc-ribbon domain-containing protein [Gemmataceae bacterium]